MIFAGMCLAMISIHAPRTGSDPFPEILLALRLSFQSTLPARGATEKLPNQAGHSPAISIHAPRTGSDGALCVEQSVGVTFQSTLPARGATPQARLPPGERRISIHAPRTGSDCDSKSFASRVWNISIHAPRTGSDGFRPCA